MNKNILIDANVILRYLLDDIEDLSLIAEQIINSDSWTTPEVLAEVEYVLRDVYELSRKDIHAAFCELAGVVYFEPQDIILKAIQEYADSNLDFVDCILVAYSKLGKSRVFTFDKGINKRLTK